MSYLIKLLENFEGKLFRIDWLSTRNFEGANLSIKLLFEYCDALRWPLTQVVEVRLDIVLRLDGEGGFSIQEILRIARIKGVGKRIIFFMMSLQPYIQAVLVAVKVKGKPAKSCWIISRPNLSNCMNSGKKMAL